MARVDIIIPLYNKADTIARTLDSVRRQDMTDWRLIVVDDGSTDGGAEVVQNLHDDRIELIRQTNQGPGAARNRGLDRVTAEYVAFLDADDEWYPWYLTNALNALREHDDIALVASMYYLWPQQRDMTPTLARRGVRPGCYRLQGTEDPVWVSEIIAFMSPWNTVARTDVVRRHGGFYEKNHCLWCEDQTLFIRIAFNEPFAVIGPPAVRYHTETSTIARLTDSHAHRLHPLEPYLAEPDLLLNDCPEEKRPLMQRFLARRALGAATLWAYHGRRRQADELLQRFPDARRFRRQYRRYLRYRYRPLWWTRLKLRWGPALRDRLRRFARTRGWLAAAPELPTETDS